MSEDPSGWSLTESDPQVFTQLLRDLGVRGLQVDDLYSLDSETLDTLKPIHALIFLFKYVGGGTEDESSGIPVNPSDTGVWFANQVINNSCGTLAALNAVMNIQPQPSSHSDEAIEHGPELENLREFGQAMESMDLGLALASHPLIREVHNSFSKSSPFSMDPSAFPEREKEDPYHFVAYVPINGYLHELDGLQSSPKLHGPVEEGDKWLDQARDTIQKRIETYPPGSVMFNLLAVRSAAIPRLTRLINDPSTPSHEKLSYQDQLEHERMKAARGDRENSLRRHNLLPVVFSLLKALGETGQIDKAVEGARAKGKARKEKAKQRGEEE